MKDDQVKEAGEQGNHQQETSSTEEPILEESGLAEPSIQIENAFSGIETQETTEATKDEAEEKTDSRGPWKIRAKSQRSGAAKNKTTKTDEEYDDEAEEED